MARHERSAGFVIYRAAEPSAGETGGPVEYLLLDAGRHWDFPKGHVEAGEDDLTAAVRELREETGIADAAVVPGFRHEIVYFFRDRKKGLIRKTVIFFLGRATARDVTISREHAGFEFLPYESALKRVTFATAKDVLRKAHAHLTGRDDAATPTLWHDVASPAAPPAEPGRNSPEAGNPTP